MDIIVCCNGIITKVDSIMRMDNQIKILGVGSDMYESVAGYETKEQAELAFKQIALDIEDGVKTKETIFIKI